MKRNTIFLLILCFVISLFTACGEAKETPTDVTNSSENSTIQQPQTQGESSQPTKETTGDVQKENQEQDGIPSQPEESAPQSPQEENQEEVTVPETQGNGNNDVQGDLNPYIPPEFTSVEGFHSWLQNGGVEEEKREDLLNSITNSTTYSDTSYCRPKLANGNQEFVLTTIEAYPYSVIYRYGFVKNLSLEMLTITTCIDPIYMKDVSENMQECFDLIDDPEKRVFDEYGSTALNEITYYYYHYPKSDRTTIYWKINGNTFKARYYGSCAQINEILPLLELEQVEYKISNANNEVAK